VRAVTLDSAGLARIPGMPALPGFRPQPTHHCVTGSMLHVFSHAGIDVSEDMLLGLGAGAGFFYWHMRGAPPMLLGRGNVHRPKTDGLEIDTSRRLGVVAERFVTGSAKKARASLDAELDAGRPVMMNVDMGYLPYFDFPDDYHFGGHVIAVAGRDGDTYLVADRDGALHPVPRADLEAARGSKHKPFPPRHMWYRFDAAGAHAPTAVDLWSAIAQNADAMLHGPISNIGVRGIRKAAGLIPKWSGQLDDAALRDACLNNFIFIDATGGTGGGLFRLMYARFLREAEAITGASELAAVADQFDAAGQRWDAAAQVFKAVYEGAPPSELGTLKPALLAIADIEQSAWARLEEAATAAAG